MSLYNPRRPPMHPRAARAAAKKATASAVDGVRVAGGALPSLEHSLEQSLRSFEFCLPDLDEHFESRKKRGSYQKVPIEIKRRVTLLAIKKGVHFAVTNFNEDSKELQLNKSTVYSWVYKLKQMAAKQGKEVDDPSIRFAKSGRPTLLGKWEQKVFEKFCFVLFCFLS